MPCFRGERATKGDGRSSELRFPCPGGVSCSVARGYHPEEVQIKENVPGVCGIAAFRSETGGTGLSTVPSAAPRPPRGPREDERRPRPPCSSPQSAAARPAAARPLSPAVPPRISRSRPLPRPRRPPGSPAIRPGLLGGGGGSGSGGAGGDKSSCAQNKGARGWLWRRCAALRMGDFRRRGFARAVPVLPLNCRVNVCGATGSRRSRPASGRC